ncbi:hypothetical protein N9F76_00640 [bacterium]|nr:hypothetical protein [bacterium]MDB4664503.1 hypothetical protein [bacterium]
MTRLILRQLLLLTSIITAITLVTSACLMAVEPNAVDQQRIRQGRVLFEREWATRNPTWGSDGLGPLHNAKSCVACHHQGGIGGSGDTRFNAKSIGIEKMKITGGPINDDVIANSVRGFHPGFVDTMGAVVNTLAVSHHGGSPVYGSLRDSMMRNVTAEFSKDGGPSNPAEVRHANASPISYEMQNGNYKVSIRARMFQRNTTPLFGSGLIDQVTDKQLEDMARQQKKHPEISGRPATLPDGRFGRFGWRGNTASLLDFCDQACAAEVGLETQRKPQPTDPTLPSYKNPDKDISDDQIRTITAFMAALPAPIRKLPQDSEDRQAALHGEELFASIGCAVCHVPSIGEAKNLYSDLLLHDMGYESIDLNPAEPYINKVLALSQFDRSVISTLETTTLYEDEVSTTPYYGRTSVMAGTNRSERKTGQELAAFDSSPVTRGEPNIRYSRMSYSFDYPKQPNTIRRFIKTGSRTTRNVDKSSDRARLKNKVGRRSETASGKDFYFTDTTNNRTKTISTRQTNYLRIHIEPTNYMQEWRTPPLWGVKDSAPYMHDGRAATLLEAVSMHEGESAGTRDRFLNLSYNDRSAIIKFMETMVAPINVPKLNL